MFETTKNFSLGVDEDDIEVLLKVVPKELTNQGLLERKKKKKNA